MLAELIPLALWSPCHAVDHPAVLVCIPRDPGRRGWPSWGLADRAGRSTQIFIEVSSLSAAG